MAAKPKTPSVFLVSIDGTRAPQFEHPTLKEAVIEAERLGQALFLQGNKHAKIRVLEQVGVLSLQVEQKVTKNWS